MVVVFLLIMLEAGITADVFLNKNWEEVAWKLLTIFYSISLYAL